MFVFVLFLFSTFTSNFDLHLSTAFLHSLFCTDEMLLLRCLVWFVGSLITTTAAAVINPSIVGTWSTKSGKVLTGPVCVVVERGIDIRR